MKKLIYILFISIIFSACSEEVTIDEILNPSDIRLVIEANIDIDKTNTTGVSTQQIKLSKTTSFYNTTFSGITGASINITDKDGNSVGTFLDINPGVDDLDDYTAIEEINEINQETITLFGDDTYRVTLLIDNEVGVDNFYLFAIKIPINILTEYGVGGDSFIQEGTDDSFSDFNYADDELVAGDIINFKIYGIGESYKNYLTKIFSIAQGSNGPFSTAPATVRGNILNTTDIDNYALGYFSLNQYVEANYTVLAE